MGLDAIPAVTRAKYHIEERRHASAILDVDFPNELKDIIDCLQNFELLRSEIEAGGGGKSKIAQRFDSFLSSREWKERSVKVARKIDGTSPKLTRWIFSKARSRSKSNGTTRILFIRETSTPSGSCMNLAFFPSALSSREWMNFKPSSTASVRRSERNMEDRPLIGAS